MNLNLLPFRLNWEDLQVGMTLISESKTLKEPDVPSFRAIQQYFYNQLPGALNYSENVFSASDDISSWLLGAALGILAPQGKESRARIVGMNKVIFHRAIRDDQGIRIRLECLDKAEREKQRWEHPSGMAGWKVELLDSENSLCLEAQVSTVVTRKHPFMEINRENLEQAFDKLTESSQAKWGLMSAQHLVEHFEYFNQMALGNIPGKILISEELIPKYQNSLWNYKALPQQFQHPMLKKGEAEELRFDNLTVAKEAFWKSFDAVEHFYRKNPKGKLMVAMFGMLDRYHWYLQNRKHFTYHFEQFGII